VNRQPVITWKPAEMEETQVARRMIYILLSLLVLSSMILAACAPAATEAPPAEPAATAVPPEPPTAEPMEPFEALPAITTDCSNGTLWKQIAAPDRYTVEFSMCVPDPSFLSKIAFSPFAIYPQEWLESTTEPGARLDAPVGTGPYMVGDWVRGESLTFVRNPNYTGESEVFADTVVFRWSAESAARLLELQAGTIDGMDNVGPADFAVIEGDPSLQLVVRPALNVFYVGMTNTFKPFDDVRVRQAVAMGIDRQRIVDTFYPTGSETASHFTPCPIPNACAGEAWYDFDPEAGKALLAEAGFPNGFDTKLYFRDVVRGYLPEAPRVAEEIQAQLKQNLGINAEIVVMESGAFIAASAAGELDGLHLLGWGADYPHITNFLNYHFGATQAQFGNAYPEIYTKLEEGAQIADPAEAEGIYTEANNAIRELVPMVPIAHGGSATAYRADVVNPQASPLTNEMFAPTDPGGRDTLVWMQNAEPISLFCPDETDGESLRACEQVMEGLYAYEINGTATFPVLAEVCEPNDDLTVWTCTLRQDVVFSDGTTFDANDVMTTFSANADVTSPLHVGNTGTFEYWSTLWGNLINAPAPE
jgi:peptide/nickel transport system substrate-binding protein